jgi:hypothetical protein
MTTTQDKTAIGTYLTLANGTEVQITGFRLDTATFEGWFSVRYPDNILSGDSYEITESQVYSAKISRKYN